jgi:hypothetical protein
MTEHEIIEIFAQAAKIEKKLPISVGPAKLKAVNIGIVHTFADMVHWPDEEKHEIRWAWLDPEGLKASRNDIGIWELAMEIMKLVPSEKNRRALWAWARAQTDEHVFAKWCRKEIDPDTRKAISPQLGNYRRSAAIESIIRAFARKALQHNETGAEPTFTKEVEKGDKQSIIEVWRSEDAVPMICDFDRDLKCFDWASIQNERRRNRAREFQARKQKAA